MSAPAIAWPCQTIERLLAPTLPALRVEVLAEVDSTNTELMRRARGGPMAPVLLVAEQQTAGRGRLGRPWRSAPGASLMFSLGLPLAPADWSGLSLAVGVGVAESLHPDVWLKWPNDLWLGGAPGERKLGGILIETASIGALRYAVIGVGLNVMAPPAVGLAMPAGHLQELLPGVGAAQVLEQVAAPLVRAVQAFEALGFAPFQARFNARDVLRGREVGLTDAQGGIMTGSAHGVTETGALLVQTDAGMQQITSSEVSVRPLQARLGPAAGEAMMRLLVLLLVLANGLYFAWSHDLLRAAGFGPAQQSEPQRLAQQIKPQELQLLKTALGPRGAPPEPAAAPAAPSSGAASAQN